MINPVVSVILPVYNGDKYLNDAVDSILNQSFKDFELIIIDDGSSDNSLSIAKEYENKDSRVVLVSQENSGLVFALNKGISLAKGQYIARMDADDISLDSRFDEQVKALKNGSDICGCHFLVIDESNRLIDSYVMPRTENSILAVLSQGPPFAHGSVMFKRSFWDTHRLSYSDSKYIHAEDYFLWTRFYECGAIFCNVDKFLFKYRFFSKSLSKMNMDFNKKDTYKISKFFIKSNKKKILDALCSDINNFTPFEKERACVTIFYLILIFGYDRKLSLLNCFPLSTKVLAFIKSLYVFLKG